MPTENGGGTYKFTEDALRKYIDWVAQFESDLNTSPFYPQLANYGGEKPSAHLALGVPEKFLAAQTLGTLFTTFATGLHTRLEHGKGKVNELASAMDDVDLLLGEGERDAHAISVTDLAGTLHNLLSGPGGGTAGPKPPATSTP
ncbi:hypothetical protein [Streptomyces sp. NPDC059991]|uniref:hypothetical protein n=1 Tax=unclassified Streptomyces TaxID=2593676 RepID=UPI00367892AB